MIDATVKDNGDLLLTATEEFELPDMWCFDEVDALYRMMEHYRSNGSYTPFDAGDGDPFVGLTDAPCIAEDISVHDDGEHEIIGRFWYFERYMLESFLEQLETNGYTVFTFGGSTG